MRVVMCCLLIGMLIATSPLRADTTLVVDGQPKAAVFVSERVWDDATKNAEPAKVEGSPN